MKQKIITLKGATDLPIHHPYNKKTTIWKKTKSTLTITLNQLYQSLMSKTPAYIISVLLTTRVNYKMIWPQFQKKMKN